jgi:hypothetical protein
MFHTFPVVDLIHKPQFRHLRRRTRYRDKWARDRDAFSTRPTLPRDPVGSSGSCRRGDFPNCGKPSAPPDVENGDERSSLEAVLLEHANRVLRDRSLAEIRLETLRDALLFTPDLSRSAVQRPAFLTADGAELEEARIDTNAHLQAVRAKFRQAATP